MRPFRLAVVLVAGIAMSASTGLAQSAPSAGPNKVVKTAKVGGEGGFDYISADVEGRRLYVSRSNPKGQLQVFNLDTLERAGTIPNIGAGGAVVDPKSHHGFSTTKPITMWDSTTLKVIKTIDLDARPDGIMFDPYNDRVWVTSNVPPYATVIDAKEGTVVGTLDLGGKPAQAVSDGKGTVYVNTFSDKANVTVVDAKKLTVTAHYDLSSKNVAVAKGLALDAKNHVLFAYYRQPSPMVVIVNAANGNIITALPTDIDVDTVEFNPATMEAISPAGGGSIVFIKENSPTSFVVEQKLQTMLGNRTMVLDTKTNHVLTMAFEYGPVPADAKPPVPGNVALGPVVPGSFTLLMVGRK